MATNNKIRFGLRNVYYAVATDDGTGALTYAAPVAIPGAVTLALTQQGGMNPFHADDIVYWMSNDNDGYDGTLEVALLPDHFKEAVLGEVKDSNGILFEKADAPTVEFALLYEFQGDQNATRRAFFRCVASRPDINDTTKTDTVTPGTDTLAIRCLPRIDTRLVKAKCPATQTTQYNSWFTTVYDTPATN
jgi:phi13 family phage major tail protein